MSNGPSPTPEPAELRACNAHGQPIGEAHGHAGCTDPEITGPCDCLCHRDEDSRGGTRGRYRVAAVLTHDAIGRVLNRVTGDTGRRFRWLWTAKREARRYNALSPGLLPIQYVVLERGE